jgi:uncharacterized protein
MVTQWKIPNPTLAFALAATTLLGIASIGQAAERVTVVGAGPGAGAFQMAGAMAEGVNRSKLDVTMTNRASPGFVANTRMVETGSSEFALTNGIFVYDAQHGNTPFKEMKAKNIRGIGPVSTSWFQIAVTQASGIKTYMDLKGKRVSYGPKGSNTEFMTRTIMQKLGIHDSIKKEYMGWDKAATAMTDGTIDAFGIPNPVPSPSILQASASAPLRILSVPPEVVDMFVKSNPGYYKATIKPGSYKGMEKEGFDTVAYTIFVTANAKVSNDVVYKVTKATYGPANRAFIVNAFKAWRIGFESTKDKGFLDQMKAFGMALHPGAAKYWAETGLTN